MECAMDRSQQRIDRQSHAEPRLRNRRRARRLTGRHADQEDGKLDRHGGDRHIAFQPGETQIHNMHPDNYFGRPGVAPSGEGAVKAMKTGA